MQVSKAIDSYNARRYGTPWAARIKSFDGRPELDFIGHAYNGSDAGGELVFDADPGEVVKIGQKDFRGKSSNDFYRVGGDGSLEQLDPVAAREAWEHWKAGGDSKPKKADIIKAIKDIIRQAETSDRTGEPTLCLVGKEDMQDTDVLREAVRLLEAQ